MLYVLICHPKSQVNKKKDSVICETVIICKPNFVPLALCSSHHQVILDVLAAVFTGALEVETLLQFLLAVSRQIEKVDVADGQLLPL